MFQWRILGGLGFRGGFWVGFGVDEGAGDAGGRDGGFCGLAVVMSVLRC